MTVLSFGKQNVNIDAGELVGYQVDGYEYVHQKGSPGWGNSDTEMFPIIGPTAEADYKVLTDHGDAIQDQHGLLRELDYSCVHQTGNCAIFEKEYTANTKVNNSKYPNKSKVKELCWPFDFKFRKTFELEEHQLSIRFDISGPDKMPFMLGYHPAFKIHSKEAFIKAIDAPISISEVVEVGNRAMPITGCNEIILNDLRNLTIKTNGFNNFMLWTEVSNMLCIEPITFYPYMLGQQELHLGFTNMEESGKCYLVQLIPTL